MNNKNAFKSGAEYVIDRIENGQSIEHCIEHMEINYTLFASRENLEESNKVISIGYRGIKRCYLNIDRDKAVERYCKSENITLEEFIDNRIDVDIIEFEDEFSAYEIY